MTSTPCWTARVTRSPSNGRIVDYVLLAEFDIDTGSTLRYQYPNEIPGYKADWFAEHMLPEGAHNRINDYSYIFLNRNKPQIDENYWLSPLIQPNDKEEQEGNNIFLYGLNVVHTKHDSSVRRGAIVKAMCIFSRYHFVDSFRKQLETSLLTFFEQDTNKLDVLQELFNTLNSLDLTQLPRPNMMECMLMRRGVHYDTIPSMISDYLPNSWNKEISLGNSKSKSNSADRSLVVSIPLYRTPDEVGIISIQTLVKTFGDATMRIYHAIFTRQRVLFVGYNHAVSDIAMMVLSAVAMVAPPMINVIKRTFPYATLFDLTFTEVSGIRTHSK